MFSVYCHTFPYFLTTASLESLCFTEASLWGPCLSNSWKHWCRRYWRVTPISRGSSGCSLMSSALPQPAPGSLRRPVGRRRVGWEWKAARGPAWRPGEGPAAGLRKLPFLIWRKRKRGRRFPPYQHEAGEGRWAPLATIRFGWKYLLTILYSFLIDTKWFYFIIQIGRLLPTQECDWPEKDCSCLCHDAKLRRHKRKVCSRCHINKVI